MARVGAVKNTDSSATIPRRTFIRVGGEYSTKGGVSRKGDGPVAGRFTPGERSRRLRGDWRTQ